MPPVVVAGAQDRGVEGHQLVHTGDRDAEASQNRLREFSGVSTVDPHHAVHRLCEVDPRDQQLFAGQDEVTHQRPGVLHR